MKPPLFRYEAPRTITEAITVIASDADAMVLAGGQSLVPAMNFRAANPSMLVDIQHVEGLKGVAVENGEIVIKAMTRHRELELDPDVRRANPLIAETMQHVAHVPIRNRGTVVGSLCHADPSAEMPLLFVLLDGTLVGARTEGYAPHSGRASSSIPFSRPRAIRMKSLSKRGFRSCRRGPAGLSTR